jgi:hypothetical protein
MAKKQQYDYEEVTASKAEAVAKTVDAQVKEDARKQEAAALKIGKETELLGEQTWEEVQDENPFKRPLQARIEEVRKNSTGQIYVKFVPVDPARPADKAPFEYLPEEEFRARFPKLVE